MSEEKLPKWWRTVKISQVVEKTSNVDPKLKFNSVFTYIDISSIDSTTFSIIDPKIISIENSPSRARQLINSGDTIVSTVRPNLKRIARVSNEFNHQIASTGFSILRPSIIINSDFLFYSVIRNEFTEALISLQRGASYPAVRNSDVLSQRIPLPPLPEQQRIVAKLDAIFGHLDVFREKLDRIPVMLKNFRQQVLTQAVNGELTKEWREENLATLDSAIVEGEKIISEKKNLYKNQTANFLEKLDESLSLELNGVFFSNDWCTIKPEFISSPEKYSIGIGPFGSNLKVSDYKTEGYPLIFVRNVIANKFDGLDPKFVDEEKFHELLPHTIKTGDLLITKMGTPPGDCKLYPEGSKDGIITSDILKVRIWKKYFVPKFYEYVISSKIVKTQIEGITKGVAHQKISLKRFKEIELPFPTKKEQEEIVKKVDTLFELSDKIEFQYQKLKAKIDQMPQAILAKAFRGELVGQEVKEYVRETGEVMMAADAHFDNKEN